MLQILAHAQRPARISPKLPERKKRDRASTSAREYHEATTALDELRAKRKKQWPNDIDEQDQQRWRDAWRRKRLSLIDMSYWSPQTDAGALAALKVVRHELEQLEAVLKTCDAEHVVKILAKAEKALRRSIRDR